MLDDDGTVYNDDDDGVDAFALASINHVHNSRYVFVVGLDGAAAAAASSLLSASSSIYLHSDV